MSQDDTATDDSLETDEVTLVERPIDRVNPEFFRDIVDEYDQRGELHRGFARLDVEDKTRRFAIADELTELSDGAYVAGEIAELVDVFEKDDEVLDEPVELVIPVADEERVIEEAAEEGTVTVMFEPAGVQTLLEQLLAALAAEDHLTADAE
ncbi:hypothetical protein ACKVMT_14240 [Halobacteriales archaeon Cl-PHB]